MSGPKTYISVPTTIEAIQFKGTRESWAEINVWVGVSPVDNTHRPPGYPPEAEYSGDGGHKYSGFYHYLGTHWLYVAANDAWLQIEDGEWVAKDDHGFYPIKDDVFARKYRLADD